MSVQREEGGAGVSLGHVTVDLKVRVRQERVACALRYRGEVVHVVFEDSELAEIVVPAGSNPEIRSE